MSANAPLPSEPSVDLKNRWLAAGLALLLPGLGHLYQGRTFKAAVYCVCILGLFLTGQALGEWKVVYLGDSETGGRIAAPGKAPIIGRLLQGYGAQFPVGALAWPAMIQSSRYHSDENNEHGLLDEPLTAPVTGGIGVETINGPRAFTRFQGTVTLVPGDGGLVRGKITGTTDEGQPIQVELSRVMELGRRVSAQEERTLAAEIAALPAGIRMPPDLEPRPGAEPFFAGGIQRPFWDRYQVPLGERGEDELTARLGGRLEIAYVFTWIAGLLNVLAIWDALDGPAYGIGDHGERKRRSRRRRNEDDSQEAERRREPAIRTA
jgi:hypothetical protein